MEKDSYGENTVEDEIKRDTLIGGEIYIPNSNENDSEEDN